MCEQLAVSKWVWRMAQLGYAAKGLLYVIVGGTAVLAVLNMGRRVRGTGGALNFLLTSPFGRLGVAFIAIGLGGFRSEEHTSELQSLAYLVCRLLLEKKKK